MKTQLLEDISQSATLTLVPSSSRPHVKADDIVQETALAIVVKPVRPRSESGVWRQKPASAPLEIAPAAAATVAAPLVAEPMIAMAPHAPLFELTLPAQTTPAPDTSEPESSWLERPARRPLLWGASMLAAAFVILAGLWFYETRQNARVPVVVTGEVQAAPPVSKTPKVRAIAAKEFTLNPDGEVLIKPPPSPSPAPSVAQAAPPVVLQRPTPIAQTPRPERTSVQRFRERQLARASVKPVESKPAPESTMAATLKACREHGYAAQRCIQRGCSVTKYGFVCRGK